MDAGDARPMISQKRWKDARARAAEAKVKLWIALFQSAAVMAGSDEYKPVVVVCTHILTGSELSLVVVKVVGSNL